MDEIWHPFMIFEIKNQVFARMKFYLNIVEYFVHGWIEKLKENLSPFYWLSFLFLSELLIFDKVFTSIFNIEFCNWFIKNLDWDWWEFFAGYLFWEADGILLNFLEETVDGIGLGWISRKVDTNLKIKKRVKLGQ